MHYKIQNVLDEFKGITVDEENFDSIAITLCNKEIERYVYLYLDPKNPDNSEVMYDFEDWKIENNTIDHCVKQNVIKDLKTFKKEVYEFLKIDLNK